MVAQSSKPVARFKNTRLQIELEFGMLVFGEGEKPSEQRTSREPTTNSTRVWHQVGESNPNRHSLSPGLLQNKSVQNSWRCYSCENDSKAPSIFSRYQIAIKVAMGFLFLLLFVIKICTERETSENLYFSRQVDASFIQFNIKESLREVKQNLE